MKIEKGIPLPKAPRYRKWGFLCLDKLEIGDSVAVTPNDFPEEDRRALFKSAHTQYRQYLGIHRIINSSLGTLRRDFPDRKFVTRRLENGVRVWRTK